MVGALLCRHVPLGCLSVLLGTSRLQSAVLMLNRVGKVLKISKYLHAWVVDSQSLGSFFVIFFFLHDGRNRFNEFVCLKFWAVNSVRLCLTSPPLIPNHVLVVCHTENCCHCESDHLSCSLPTNPSLAIFHFSKQIKYFQMKIMIILIIYIFLNSLLPCLVEPESSADPGWTAVSVCDVS